jgi:hypothetical protein
VTKLLQRLHDELVRRHYAATTRESYLKIVRSFSRHAGRRLDRVGPDELGGIRYSCLKSGSWRWARWWPRSPPCGSSSYAC